MMMMSVMVGVMMVSIVMIKNGCVVLAILVMVRLRVGINIIKDEHRGDDDYGFGCLKLQL